MYRPYQTHSSRQTWILTRTLIYDPEGEGITGSRTALERERYFVEFRRTAHQDGTSPLSVFYHLHLLHWRGPSAPAPLLYDLCPIPIVRYVRRHDHGASRYRPGAPPSSRCRPGCRGLPWHCTSAAFSRPGRHALLQG